MTGGPRAGDPCPDRGGAFTYRGGVRWSYRPRRNNRPDPGEVVWAWVCFEEDDTVGKDRPVVVVGDTTDRRLVALMLSSRDHSEDNRWLSVGVGPWDREGRESWVRIDRFLAVESSAVRREGSALSRTIFERVVIAAGGRPRRSVVGALRSLVRR